MSWYWSVAGWCIAVSRSGFSPITRCSSVLSACGSPGRLPPQAPGTYRHKVGNFEVTVLSDGNLPFDADLFSGDKDRAGQLLDNAYFPKKSTTSVNTWLVNTGKQLVLVDTGASSHFGPTLGKLPQHLADAGVTPDQIDVVIITHMHPDHVPGLLTAAKKALFKNAVVHVGDQEHGFWTSEQIYNSVPQDVKGFFDIARMSIKPYAESGKLQMFKAGVGFDDNVGTRPYARPQHGTRVVKRQRAVALGRHCSQCSVAIPRAGS